MEKASLEDRVSRLEDQMSGAEEAPEPIQNLHKRLREVERWKGSAPAQDRPAGSEEVLKIERQQAHLERRFDSFRGDLTACKVLLERLDPWVTRLRERYEDFQLRLTQVERSSAAWAFMEEIERKLKLIDEMFQALPDGTPVDLEKDLRHGVCSGRRGHPAYAHERDQALEEVDQHVEDLKELQDDERALIVKHADLIRELSEQLQKRIQQGSRLMWTSFRDAEPRERDLVIMTNGEGGGILTCEYDPSRHGGQRYAYWMAMPSLPRFTGPKLS